MSHNPSHHRRSIRLKGYDYSQAGLYFITICTKNMQCVFGNIVDCEMMLNPFGNIAQTELLKTTEKRSNMIMDTCQVMPNHIHFILEITHKIDTQDPNRICPDDKIESNTKSVANLNLMDAENCFDEYLAECYAIAEHSSQKQSRKMPHSPSNTVGAMVRGFKSTVTSQLITLGFTDKLWLVNYHEHIIRDSSEYDRIVHYIKNNPNKWKQSSAIIHP